MSHPEPHGQPDLKPITVREVFENPVTRERCIILVRLWDNPEGPDAHVDAAATTSVPLLRSARACRKR